jgi:hypothetical protein
MDTAIRRRLSPTALGLLVLIAVGLVALVPYVVHAGFHADDWVDSANYRFHSGHGFWAAVNDTQSSIRKSWWVVRTLQAAVLGDRMVAASALVALASLVEVSLFFLLLRKLGVAACLATATALIVLLLPAADSTRLWSTGLQMTLFAGCLMLGGVLVSLRGLELPGRRGTAMHALALLLFALSVNGYELAAPAIALAGALYIGRAPARIVAARWVANVVVVAAVLIQYEHVRRAPDSGSSFFWQHAHLIAHHGLIVLARAAFPFGGFSHTFVLVAMAAVFGYALAARMRARFAEHHEELQRGLVLTAGGCAVLAVSWLMIVPANLGYDPLSSGVGNRINLVAAMAIAVILAGMALLIAALIRIGGHNRGLGLSVLATLLLVPIVVHDFVAFRSDARDWNRAARENRALLAELHRLVPDPAPGTRIFTFGVPGYSAPSVPIFGGGGNRDLAWATRLLYDSSNVYGFPVLSGMTIDCGPGALSQRDSTPDSTARYGRAIFVDIPGRRVIVPRNRRQCLDETRRLMPYAPVNE